MTTAAKATMTTRAAVLAEYFTARLGGRLGKGLAARFAERLSRRFLTARFVTPGLVATGAVVAAFITPRFPFTEGLAAFATLTGFVTPGTRLAGVTLKTARRVVITTRTTIKRTRTIVEVTRRTLATLRAEFAA